MSYAGQVDAGAGIGGKLKENINCFWFRLYGASLRRLLRGGVLIEFFRKQGDWFSMTFASRQDAGRRLGNHLRAMGVEVDVVTGLPRGGVIVAAEVAQVLQRPLDVILVRKIGHPLFREFAVGALAEADTVVLDEASLRSHPVAREKLLEVLKEEALRLKQYQFKFRPGEKPDFDGKRVLVVDDGLATGATTEAAVLSAKRQGASKVIVAVPIASDTAVRRLKRTADEVMALYVDPDFDAVGRYYEAFSQTTDEEVVDLLRAAHAHG